MTNNFRPLRPHYLKPNEATRTPRNWIFFDTEAIREGNDRGEQQTFMLAQAVHDRERSDRGYKKTTTWATFFDCESLWGWFASKARKGSRLIVVAHNLAYDLRIAQAFTILPAMGWVADKIKLDPGCASVHWMKDGATIQMIDLYSFVSMPLQDIGLAVNLPKYDMPECEATELDWLAYCRRDVEILQAAFWRIINFVRDENLGNWQPSGSGQAFSAWRHRFFEENILVGNDESVRYLEREAAWTGRCEVWQHGTMRNGPFVEWDYQMAYGNVATSDYLPVAAKAVKSTMTIEKVRRYYPKVMVLARVRITTLEPTVPTKSDGKIVWPIGTFETTLWAPELLLAHSRGATVEFLESRLYATKPALKRFMEWAIDCANGNGPGEDAIVRSVCKQWTRSLVGRLGMHYHSWQPFAESNDSDCVLIDGVDLDTGESFRLMRIGTKIMRQSELLEFPDGTPAIMSFVMSEMRVRLYDAMLVAGLENVLYIDTDSLIVTGEGSSRLDAATKSGKLPGLRAKHSYAHIDLWAPRQIMVDTTLKAAGVSKRAKRVDSSTFTAESWQSLTSALKNKTADKVVIRDRTIRLKGIDNKRIHNSDGSTSPITLRGENARESA